jgi:hypothetical protein
MWDLWWTTWAWGMFFPSTLVSVANSNSTDCSTLIIIHHSATIRARCTKYTQFLPTPSNKRIITLSSISNFLLHSRPAVFEVLRLALLQILLTVSSCSESWADSCPKSQIPRASRVTFWQRPVQHRRSDQVILSPVYSGHGNILIRLRYWRWWKFFNCENNYQAPWPDFASELYQTSGRRLLSKLVQIVLR